MFIHFYHARPGLIPDEHVAIFPEETPIHILLRDVDTGSTVQVTEPNGSVRTWTKLPAFTTCKGHELIVGDKFVSADQLHDVHRVFDDGSSVLRVETIHRGKKTFLYVGRDSIQQVQVRRG